MTSPPVDSEKAKILTVLNNLTKDPQDEPYITAFRRWTNGKSADQIKAGADSLLKEIRACERYLNCLLKARSYLPLAGKLASLLPVIENRTINFTRSEDARDGWLYDKCWEGLTYSAIKSELDDSPREWGRISSPQGIKKVVAAFAKRHGLAVPPKKAPGRRPKEIEPAGG